MATPEFDDLTAALNLCESPSCAGHPEQCSSCYAIASVLAKYRGRADRAERKTRAAAEALGELYAWVKNWDVAFLDDEEWPETRTKVEAHLPEGWTP